MKIVTTVVSTAGQGELKANAGRNLFLGATLVFALGLAVAGAVKFVR